MRLLLATAHTNLRLSLELLFSEQPGVEIVGAASEGDGLLALIHTTNPDMIMMDWAIQGRPSLASLNEIQRARSRKIILLTTDIDDIQSAKDVGVDAVIHIGASPDVLLTTFKQVRAQINRKEGDNV